MHDSTSPAGVTALLRGGPADIPEPMRTCRVSSDDDTVKLRWLNGYEHFRREDPATENGDAVVFRWITRTRIAE